MNQNFSDYKKQLEDYLIKINFIYSGDVVKSEQKKFFKRSNNRNFSAILISEIICDIYNYSFNRMIEKSKEFVVHKNKFIDVYHLMDDLNLNPKILFFSKNSNMSLDMMSNSVYQCVLQGITPPGSHNNGYLPDYFNRRFKLMGFGKEVSAYYSPMIEDSIDDCNFYLVDRPIQSMVWSLQNMEYDIIEVNGEYEHHVSLPIYDCDYDVYKIRVLDTQKLREEKINTLLWKLI